MDAPAPGDALRALSACLPGEARFAGSLGDVSLRPRWAAAVRSRDGIRWEETVPPAPRRLVARNESAEPVRVEAGALIAGGWSTRTVVRGVEVAAGVVAVVPVEPFAERWSPGGGAVVVGVLDPVLHAVLLTAEHGAPGIRSSARAALRAARRIAARPPERDGHLLLDGDEPVAAWSPLLEPRAAPGRLHRAFEPLLRAVTARSLQVAVVAEPDGVRIVFVPATVATLDRLLHGGAVR